MKIPFNTALITGSSRGIGRGIAVKLAKEGVQKIAVHYRTRKDEAETTVSQLRTAGATGVLVQGDVSDASVAENVVKEAAEKLGGCDIFVHSVIPPLDQAGGARRFCQPRGAASPAAHRRHALAHRESFHVPPRPSDH